MSKKKKKLNKKSKSLNTVKYDVLRIDWKDHFSANHQWQMPNDMDHEPKRCVSIGIKVYEDEEVVTLAQNMGINQQAADTTTILKNCITHRTVLGEITYGKL